MLGKSKKKLWMSNHSFIKYARHQTNYCLIIKNYHTRKKLKSCMLTWKCSCDVCVYTHKNSIYSVEIMCHFSNCLPLSLAAGQFVGQKEWETGLCDWVCCWRFSVGPQDLWQVGAACSWMRIPFVLFPRGLWFTLMVSYLLPEELLFLCFKLD